MTNPFTLNIDKGGRPPVFETPQQMTDKIEAYFTSIWDEEEQNFSKRPTMTGMALFLGFQSRQSMYDYIKKEGFSYIITRARCVVEQSYEELLATKVSSGAIFALKNMGWNDKTTVDLNASHKAKDLTPEERDLRIAELISKAQEGKNVQE